MYSQFFLPENCAIYVISKNMVEPEDAENMAPARAILDK